MQQHSVVQALQAGGAPSRDPIEEANQVGEHPPPKRKKSLKPKVTFGSKVTIVPAMDQALQVHASSEVAQEIPGDPTPELRLIVTGAELWSGTCPYMTAMAALRIPGCTFLPLMFSEKLPEARQYAAARLPTALDYGPFQESMHEAVDSPHFVAMTPECAPYLKCGRQRMQHDPRSKQIMQSARQIKHWKPRLLMLEEAPEFFDLDKVHGLWTQFEECIQMIPCPIVTQQDRQAGGSTIRTRKFAVYEDSASYYSLPPWQLQPSPILPPTPIRTVLDCPDLLTSDLFVAGLYKAYSSPQVKQDGMIVLGTVRVGGPPAGAVPKVLVRWDSALYRVESVDNPGQKSVRMLRQGWQHRKVHKELHVQPDQIRPAMLEFETILVYSFDGVAKSPRQWGEGYEENLQVWVEDRLDKPYVRILSYREQWRMMRTGGWPPHAPLRVDNTLQVLEGVGASPDRIRRMAASSVATSMHVPQAKQCLDRLVQGAMLPHMHWHPDVTVRHWDSPVYPGTTIRVYTLIVSLFPEPAILLSHGQYIPVTDIVKAGRGHDTAFSIGDRCNKALALQSEPFMAGQMTSPAGHNILLSAIPVRDTAAVVTALTGLKSPPLWTTIPQVTIPLLRDAAAITLAKMSTFVGLSPALNDMLCSPFATGAVRPFMNVPREAHGGYVPYETAVRASIQADNNMKRYLMSVDVSATVSNALQVQLSDAVLDAVNTELKVHHDHVLTRKQASESLKDWVDAIRPQPLDEIAPSLKQGGCYDYSDPSLKALLFSDFCSPPETDWLPLTENQSCDESWLATVKCRRDTYITGVPMQEQTETFALQLQTLDDMAAKGTKAKRKFKGTRAWNDLNKVPQARGLVLDYTHEHDGIVKMLVYDQPHTGHMNSSYMLDMAEGYPDQEMISMGVLGLRSKSPLADQFVINAHSQSVSMGVPSIEKGILKRFYKGMCTITPNPPYDQARYVSNSATEKKGRPEEPRVCDNQTAPVDPVQDDHGTSVISSNYSCRNQTEIVRNPYEAKPTLSMMAQGAAVMRHAGQLVEPAWDVYYISLDGSDYFNAMGTAPEEWPKNVRFTRGLLEGHTTGSHVGWQRGGYGHSAVSNYGQRFAYFIQFCLDRIILEIQEAMLGPVPQAIADWLDFRATLNGRNRRKQDRLYYSEMFSDDLGIVVLSKQMVVVVLTAIMIFTVRMNFLWADKNTLGTTVLWVGGWLFLALGFVVIPQDKCIRACAQIRMMFAGELTYELYEKLWGLLIHVILLPNLDRTMIEDLADPIIYAKKSRKSLKAKMEVQDGNLKHHPHVGPKLKIILTGLEQCNGTRITGPSPGATKEILGMPAVHAYGDAYRDVLGTGEVDAGIGATLGPYWWHYKIPPELAKLLDTPLLEFLAYTCQFEQARYHRLLPQNVDRLAVAIHGDGLAAITDMAAGSLNHKAMRMIKTMATEHPEYKRVLPRLFTSHQYGLGNQLGDAASRDEKPRITMLMYHLRMTPVQLLVSPEVPKMIAQVATYVAQLRHGAQALLTEGQVAQSELYTQDQIGDHKAIIGPRFSTEEKQGRQSLAMGRQGALANHEVTMGPEFASDEQGDGPDHLAPPSPMRRTPKKGAMVPTPQSSAGSESSGASPLRRSPRVPDSPSRQIIDHPVVAARPLFRSPVKTQDRFMSSPLKKPRLQDTGKMPASKLFDLNRATLAVATTRLRSKFDEAYSDRPQYAIANSDLLEDMVDTHVQLVEAGVPVNTKANEHSHVRKYWIPMCADLGINWQRPERSSMTQDEVSVEQYLLAFLCPYAYTNMEPGHKNKALGRPPDPESAMNVVSNVNRHFGRHNDDRFSTHQARLALTGLLQRHVDTHGPIQPDRQYPFSRDIITALLALPSGTMLGTYKLDWTTTEGKNLRVMFESPTQSGTRLDELTQGRKAWTKAKMSRGSIYYLIDGEIVVDPTREELLPCGEGTLVFLTPATSKCDRWGEKHGGKVIVFPYLPHHIWNGARAIIEMELADPVRGVEARRNTPFIRRADGQAFTNHFVRRILHYMLAHPTVSKHCTHGIKAYSFHSYRRFYATCLGQAGASKERIQAMCRWLSDEAVEIYNVMSIEEQVEHVQAAYNAAPHLITPSQLSQLAQTQLDDHDLYRTWGEFCHVDITMDTVVDSM